jgi:hypothetical protein
VAITALGRTDMANQTCDDHIYGPQGEHLDALVAKGKSFDTVAFFGPVAARTDSYTVLLHKWQVRQDAILASGREPAMKALLSAMRYRSAAGVSQLGAPAVIWWTACALLIRDLITDHGFTQEFYDELTCDWRTKVGAIHPDDELLVDAPDLPGSSC